MKGDKELVGTLRGFDNFVNMVSHSTPPPPPARPPARPGPMASTRLHGSSGALCAETRAIFRLASHDDLRRRMPVLPHCCCSVANLRVLFWASGARRRYGIRDVGGRGDRDAAGADPAQRQQHCSAGPGRKAGVGFSVAACGANMRPFLSASPGTQRRLSNGEYSAARRCPDTATS